MNNKSKTNPEIQNQNENENQRPAQLTRDDSGDTERAPPSNQQQSQNDLKEENINGDEKEQEEEEDYSDPSEPVRQFDWTNLEQQYLESMAKCDQHEAELMQEWADLMNVRTSSVTLSSRLLKS